MRKDRASTARAAAYWRKRTVGPTSAGFHTLLKSCIFSTRSSRSSYRRLLHAIRGLPLALLQLSWRERQSFCAMPGRFRWVIAPALLLTPYL